MSMCVVWGGGIERKKVYTKENNNLTNKVTSENENDKNNLNQKLMKCNQYFVQEGELSLCRISMKVHFKVKYDGRVSKISKFSTHSI